MAIELGTPGKVQAVWDTFFRYAYDVSDFVKKHERLTIVVLAAALIWGVSGKVQDAIAHHDQKNLEAAQTVAAIQAQKNGEQGAENAKLAQGFAAQLSAATAANQQLERTNALLADTLKKQQAKDAQLSPAELAQRIEVLAQLPSGAVVPSQGGYSVAQPGAVQIAQKLEVAPALQQQLNNTKAEKANVETTLAKQTLLVDGQGKEIAGLKTQIVDDGKVCDQRVKVAKDAASKGKRRAFIFGYIGGLATRGAIKFFTGV